MLNAYGRSADHTVAGYYISWGAYDRNYTPRDIDVDKLTHIIYAFANVDKGEVALGDPAVDPRNFAELRQLKAKNARLKILIAVGGWAGSKHFSDVAATKGSRKRFADSAIVFLRSHGFDGIDLDWEYPVAGGREDNTRRPEDRENFTLLLQALRAALDIAGEADGKRYVLTIAAGGSEEYVANTELQKIAETVDWLGLMSYDFAGPWSKTSGHNAPLFADPANPSPDARATPSLRRSCAISMLVSRQRNCSSDFPCTAARGAVATRETTESIRNAPAQRRERGRMGYSITRTSRQTI
jgi:chitinase